MENSFERSSRCGSFVLAIAACLGVGHAALARAIQPTPQTTDYPALTNSKVQVTNFNPEPFSGLVFDLQGSLWAVNPYGNTIVRYATSSLTTPGTTGAVFPTGLNPVSIATWGTGANLKLVVACNGTHGLFLHDPVDGRILNFLALPGAEPADLVVDPDTNQAFVSCQGTHTVVRVDLTSFLVTDSYPIPCGSRPGALYLDRQGAGSADNRVYVAPAVTGNNSTTVNPDPQPGPTEPPFDPAVNWKAASTIRDLDGNTFPDHQLPDEDVFRIDPYTLPAVVVAVVRRAGSLIFDIDRNPFNQNFWILSTDSKNKTPVDDTEPKLRGAFVVNQLKTIANLNNSSGLILAGGGLDLDDYQPHIGGAQYNPARSVNQARTLEFIPSGLFQGFGFVASAQSDLILRLKKNGQRDDEFSFVVPRSQCYDLAIFPSSVNLLCALCLGTMTVEVFDWTLATNKRVNSLPLGFDPTPAQVRRGRDVFLDGQRSLNARSSCASCHPRGMTDLLCWPLRGHPTDEKDVMLTQSLLSIADTFPHHWRGERKLADFQDAFGGLLGTPTSLVPQLSSDPNNPGEMDDFIVYMQSLQAPANPIESPLRVLDEARGTVSLPSPPVTAGLQNLSSVVRGKNVFLVDTSFNEKTCAACHTPQSGGDGSLMTEGFNLRAPRSMPIEMAHLRQLLLRRPLFKTIDALQDGHPRDVNLNGFGTLHDGREASLLHFMVDRFNEIPEISRADAFRFVEQFDQGISPAVHWGVRYAASNATIENSIQSILLDGAAQTAGGAPKLWNDVVAVGLFDPDDNGPLGMLPARWWYDSAATPDPLFRSDDPTIAPIKWNDMKTKTQTGFAAHVFYGVPPRNGRRIGIDHDGDGLTNGKELLPPPSGTGTDPWKPDTDGDGWPDGYEDKHGDNPLVAQGTSSDLTFPNLLESQVEFVNSRLAKYHVRFSEDVTYSVSYRSAQQIAGGVQGPPRSFARRYFSTADTFVLTHEEQSTQAGAPSVTSDIINRFAAEITFRDRKGLTRTLPLPSFDADFTHFPDFQLPNPTPGQPGTGANLHVSQLTPTVFDNTGGTLDAKVKIRLDYNYGAPDYVPKPATDRMAFCSLAVKGATATEFTKVNLSGPGPTFTTSSGPTSFLVRRFTDNTNYDYDVAPGKDWLCSPHTGSTGQPGPEETEVLFQVFGLSSGDTVRFSVMGVVMPFPGSSPLAYVELTLQELQPHLLEDSMSLDFTIP
jgi:hypothetical protein